MSSNAHTTGAPTTYLSRVWLRLRRSRIATFGLGCIGSLLLLAIVAPLLSHNQPLLWDAGQGLESPFLSSLFNRLVFENGVDIYFNLLLVLGPLYLALYFILRWRRRVAHTTARASILGRVSPSVVLLSLHHLLFFATIPERVFSIDNPAYYTEPVSDYVE